MTIICSTYKSTRDFSFHNNCFTAEASDIGGTGGRCFDGRVYDDACDVGFILVSHLTGDSVLFVQDGVDTHDDEVMGWRYKATHIADRSVANKWHKLPAHLEKLTALVIND
jgi:hypothetical protein